MKISLKGSAIFLIAACISCHKEKPSDVFDIGVKNAQIIDGTGAAPFYATVLTQGGRIERIEKDTATAFDARVVIDAKNMILAPGFIDTHAHGDPLATPDFRNFLAMGVTTIFLGQDGFSPNTSNLASWMDSADHVQPGVNIGMFVGHGTLRMISGTAYEKYPKEEDFQRMKNLLEDAMMAGCFGMTTGLEYNPGYLATHEELVRLAKVVGAHKGMIMSHIRNEDDQYIEESLEELIALGAYCPVHVSHIKIVYGKGEARAMEILQKLEKERQSGKIITADLYPYDASYTSISILFPEWAKPPAVYEEVVANRGRELEEYLKNRVNLRNGPEATLIGDGPFKGKTLAEIAERNNKTFEKVLLEDIGPSGTSAAYFVMGEDVMKVFLQDEHVNICTDGSPTSNHPRSYGSFAKVIEEYVVVDSLLSLPAAIHKMTGLAAKHVGLKGRGLIQTGLAADLVIFNPEEVKARATYENASQLAEGFEYVIVNGIVAKQGNEFRKRNGKIIKRQN